MRLRQRLVANVFCAASAGQDHQKGSQTQQPASPRTWPFELPRRTSASWTGSKVRNWRRSDLAGGFELAGGADVGKDRGGWFEDVAPKRGGCLTLAMATVHHQFSEFPASDEATLVFYAGAAPVYSASGPSGVSRHLPGFLDLLPPGASILELGCGGGRDSEEMLAQGFQVDPTDGVPEIAGQAEARIGRTVRVIRFDELDAVEAYDAVWANACLLHVPREALPGVLLKVSRALKPGGLHFASYKGGGVEGRDKLGRYFNYLSVEEVVAIYKHSAEWDVLSLMEYIGGGYEGGQGPWVAITVRKPL